MSFVSSNSDSSYLRRECYWKDMELQAMNVYTTESWHFMFTSWCMVIKVSTYVSLDIMHDTDDCWHSQALGTSSGLYVPVYGRRYIISRLEMSNGNV